MWVDRLITWLFPSLLLKGTPWYHLWQSKERDEFRVVARIVYPVVGIAYAAHYFFFDRVMNLQPLEFWFRFRMSMLTMAWVVAAFYFIPSLGRSRYYKVPAMIAGALICYFQARVLNWYEGGLYFYAFGFAIVSTIILRLSVLQSLIYTIAIIAIQWPSYLEAGIGTPLLFSATAITLIFVAFARSGYVAELKYFVANQQNIDNQRRIIELNIEFSDRIRAFLPKEISTRLLNYVESRRMTILQAIEEVLRPRRREIACLFSDIRGFTRATQEGDSNSFVDDGVIPNVKECTFAIERNGGIPRKIGDLLFAYFDKPDPRENLERCLSAAIELIEANRNFNSSRPERIQINRYVLMTFGSATVGNLGGFDSSIEITALGNPVNFLSRLDEVTKHPSIRPLISNTHIVMDVRTAEQLRDIIGKLETTTISLANYGVRIRDFESVDQIFLLQAGATRTQDPKPQPGESVGTNVTISRSTLRTVPTVRT